MLQSPPVPLTNSTGNTGQLSPFPRVGYVRLTNCILNGLGDGYPELCCDTLTCLRCCRFSRMLELHFSPAKGSLLLLW